MRISRIRANIVFLTKLIRIRRNIRVSHRILGNLLTKVRRVRQVGLVRSVDVLWSSWMEI